MLHYGRSLIHARKMKMDERGATAVEYGLLVALIAAVIVAIVATLGTKISTAFTTITGQLPGGAPAPVTP